MKKKILIFGISGMLGSILFTYLKKKNIYVFGVLRKNCFKKRQKNLIICKKLENETISRIVDKVKPDFVINCVGIINHKIKNNLNEVFYINSILPHIIAQKCLEKKIKYLHISTDCVFDGKKGNYSEKNLPNALDNYGLSKKMGETNIPLTTVIRTSIIGHEIKSSFGLLEWFLSQKKSTVVKGFSKAFFSGLTTLELSKIIYNYFIKRKYKLKNIMHIGGPKIDKYSLLRTINTVYSKKIKIKKCKLLKVDKSLNSMLFRQITGYKSPNWKTMIVENKNFYEKNF